MGASGQKVPHQPLRPLKTAPPAKASPSTASTPAPTSRPLWLSSGWRIATANTNRPTAMPKAAFFSTGGKSSARAKPASRGSWFMVAIGHTCRHRPGAMTNNAGTSGMARPQNSFKPSSGRHSNSAASISVAARARPRATHHTAMGTRGCSLV